MRLSQFSDMGLRLLIILAHQPTSQLFTIHLLSKRLNVSENHLVKVVHFMGQQGWILTTRGKNGGFRLNSSTLDLTIGYLLKLLEGEKAIVDCDKPPCPFSGKCSLKHILDGAENQFFEHLNQYQLKHLIHPPQKSTPIALYKIEQEDE
jgi:Rrf2 family nitric oxide-sensitive transcriptional repressor